MALRVLLADESSTIKRVMQLALQDYGVEVKAVPVGLDVLPVAKTFKPDVIFADVLLSKRNGYEICADLKGDDATKTIPIILMWSGFMEIDENKMKQAAPEGRLEKPFDAETLRQLVQNLVPKTQENPLSAYLQFPKMPDFEDKSASKKAGETPAVHIPEEAPINFDKFDPEAEGEDSLFMIPEAGTHSGLTSTSQMHTRVENLETIESADDLLVANDEEFASVPLQSNQQKDQLEDDGWQQQDLKKFKIQIPTEAPSDEDFAKKFVIPQGDLANPHIETEGEFEELHFDDDLKKISAEAVEKVQTKISEKLPPKIVASAPAGTDSEMIERVIRAEAREVIENICWKVIPEMAERIVREEINKILRDVEKSV